jgi:hypothetical protein
MGLVWGNERNSPKVMGKSILLSLRLREPYHDDAVRHEKAENNWLKREK